ncbi:hypothetical protein GCM10025886_14000 [Tetragenococcus halophilus subsp. flandriensis]|uniref:hypothetical protein n=1 Tax=Tetragenococcus halophilus TaxID=51669 RepID=UPI0023E9AAFA|nr:hypothetical protein [Tetragenococcus halophilus]GMA08249.1 hypothetical protein GCM10025886_14000 [Tetragenococcus halophilus subsp. flandriensis]
MNYRTVEALELEKERLFSEVKRFVNVKYETVKETVKDDIIDASFYYLTMLVDRISRNDYDDPNFENSIDYQLVNALSERFWDWFEEHYNEKEVMSMNQKAT